MGGLAWVKSTGVDGRRTVLRQQASALPLLEAAKRGSKVTAVLAAHAVARLDKCKGGWCRLKAPGGSGWAPQDALWGADDRPQCR
jgi:SH3-like domain-containing protein